jgi:hypothetical protein
MPLQPCSHKRATQADGARGSRRGSRTRMPRSGMRAHRERGAGSALLTTDGLPGARAGGQEDGAPPLVHLLRGEADNCSPLQGAVAAEEVQRGARGGRQPSRRRGPQRAALTLPSRRLLSSACATLRRAICGAGRGARRGWGAAHGSRSSSRRRGRAGAAGTARCGRCGGHARATDRVRRGARSPRRRWRRRSRWERRQP